MRGKLVLLIGGCVLLCAVTANGQQLAVAQMFGNGIHAYFSGEPAEACGYFDQAIEAGTKDPRPHYFRGLAYLKLGREPEAEEDE